MDPYTLAIQVSKVADKRHMVVTPAGWDIFRCIVLKWIEEAQRGVEAARHMEAFDTTGTARAQRMYYDAAASFMTGCISRTQKKQYRIDDLVRLFRVWPEGEKCPKEWAEYLETDREMGGEGVNLFPTHGGSGGDRHGSGGPGETAGQDANLGEAGAADHRPHRAANGTAKRKRPDAGKADRGRKLGGDKSGSAGRTGRKPAPVVKARPKRTGNKGK